MNAKPILASVTVLSVFVVAFVLLAKGCHSPKDSRDPIARTESLPSAIVSVTPTLATLEITISDRETWSWYNTRTPNNALEYEWQIFIGGAEPFHNHSFGFTMFKYPGAIETTGSFGRLITAGQVNLWKSNWRGGSVHDAVVNARFIDGHLKIWMQDEGAIEEVFRSRPQTCMLSISIPGEPRRREEIRIKYSGMQR